MCGYKKNKIAKRNTQITSSSSTKIKKTPVNKFFAKKKLSTEEKMALIRRAINR